MSRERHARSASKKPRDDEPKVGPLRIIGGALRGRQLRYSGDRRTRPMKERVREAAFNLVGPRVKGMLAIDLFAGTGALGFEAISRGAAGAVFIERHFPTARLIAEEAQSLGVADSVELLPGDAFLAFRKPAGKLASPDPAAPWLVMCSPPFDFYVDRCDDLVKLLEEIRQLAPAGSLLVVEADMRFDFAHLAQLGAWDVREYSPAVLGIAQL